jgi:transcriptional regulator with XRE-family HTH domain
MTQTLTTSQQQPVGQRLSAARKRGGLSHDEASSATGLLGSYLASLEDGRRRPLPGEVDRISRAYAVDLSDLLPPRRPVQVDSAAGKLAVDGHERPVRDLADDREVYAAYLFLLYAVRGAQPGERLRLRSSDVDLLMGVVGDDAETIESRLVQLMGCSPGEASMLRSVLLRHRAVTAALGTAAALSWVAVAAPGAPAERPASTSPLSGGASGASYFDADDPDGIEDDSQPAQDVLEGTWSPSYASTAEDDAAAR